MSVSDAKGVYKDMSALSVWSVHRVCSATGACRAWSVYKVSCLNMSALSRVFAVSEVPSTLPACQGSLALCQVSTMFGVSRVSVYNVCLEYPGCLLWCTQCRSCRECGGVLKCRPCLGCIFRSAPRDWIDVSVYKSRGTPRYVGRMQCISV